MADKNIEDIVPTLITLPYRHMEELGKRVVLNAERPTPQLLPVARGTSNRAVNYDQLWYGQYSWLTGSSTLNKLYCWPCLLFAPDSRRKCFWIRDGFNDFGSFHSAAKSHERSKIHSECTNELRTLVPIDLSLIAGLIDFNFVMRKIVAVALKLCKTDVAATLYRNDSSGAQFKTIFMGFMQENAKVKQMCEQLEIKCPSFFSTILKDIVDVASYEILKKQKEILEKVQYVSIQMDHTRESTDSQFHTVIARYVDEKGVVNEQFLGFAPAPQEEEEVQLEFMKTLDSFLGHDVTAEKLVSVSFCGITYNEEFHEGYNRVLLHKAPTAILTHSVSHKHEIILVQALSLLPNLRMFFVSLQSLLKDLYIGESRRTLYRFFNKNANTEYGTELYWSLDGRVLRFLMKRRGVVIDTLNIRRTRERTPGYKLAQADQHFQNLHNHFFMFCLFLFNHIFSVTDELFAILRTHPMDVDVCKEGVQKAVRTLTDSRVDAMPMSLNEEVLQLLNIEEISAETIEFLKSFYRGTTILVIHHITSRYGHLADVKFFELAEPVRFDAFHVNFPTAQVYQLVNKYPAQFDTELLIDELRFFIYNDKNYHVSPPEILKYIRENNLSIVVKESYKFFTLMSTLPIVPIGGTSCFQRLNSCLEKIKPLFPATSAHQLCVVMVNSALLIEMESKSTWHDELVELLLENHSKYALFE